jgi:hypothetical protein
MKSLWTNEMARPVSYHQLRRKYGLDEAKRIAEASRAATDSPFRRVPGYLYTEQRKHVAQLKNEAAAARAVGIDAQWITDVPLPFETRGAVLFPGEFLAALGPHGMYSLAFDWPGEHPDGLFWDTDDPYHTIRWQDTDAGAFLIVSGEDQREDAEGAFASLLAFAREHFQVKTPRYRWSGKIQLADAQTHPRRNHQR